MPGLKGIKVDQMEEQDMTQEEPNQRSPRERTLTSGCCLAKLEFDDKIQPIDLSMNQRIEEVASVFTDDNRYLIIVGDHQKITAMVFGKYPVTEAAGQKRTCDLSISKVFVNDGLNQAVQETTHMLSIVNNYFTTVKP